MYKQSKSKYQIGIRLKRDGYMIQWLLKLINFEAGHFYVFKDYKSSPRDIRIDYEIYCKFIINELKNKQHKIKSFLPHSSYGMPELASLMDIYF